MAIADYLRKLIEMKNQLVANLNSMGVTADESEKLNTLVPKVLECKEEQNVEFVESTEFKMSVYNNVSITGIKKVVIPDGTIKIGDYAFHKCTSLESVIIPNTVTSISIGAFSNCTALKSLVIPDSVTSIWSDVAVGSTNLTTITINGNISVADFKYVKKIIVSDGSTKIRSNFTNGTEIRNSVKEVVIPTSVTSIESPDSTFGAFKNCTNLSDIYYAGTEEQWNAISKGSYWNYQMGSNVSGGTTIHYNYVPE